MHPLAAAMHSAWQVVAERFQAYELVVPGTPAFECLVSACTEHCCNRYTVNLSERDVDRVVRLTGRAPRDFLECEDGDPIVLPIAQPYVLSRAESTCVFLRPDFSCGEYEARPNACRLYPHFVIFVHPESGRPTYGDTGAIARAFRECLAGEIGALVPVLMRHRACPGFGGARLIEEGEWLALLRETARIQYAPEDSADWPMSNPRPPVTLTEGARSLS